MGTLSMCGVHCLGRLSTTSEIKRTRYSVSLNYSHPAHDFCMCDCTDVVFHYPVSSGSDQTVGGLCGGSA